MAKKYATEHTILVKGGYVSEDMFRKAAERAQATGKSLVDTLIDFEVLSPDLFGQAMAEYKKLPYADLNSVAPVAGWHKKISKELATTYKLVLFREDTEQKAVTIATSEPGKLKDAKTALQAAFPKYTISFAYSLDHDVREALRVYDESFSDRLGAIFSTQQKKVSTSLDEVFAEALREGASDIHFEPRDETVHIRFRIDGVLVPASTIPHEYYKNVVNRIKVLAGLRIDEHTRSQDGSIRFFDTNNRPLDLRVSLVPTISGEKVVIRILSKYVSHDTLENLGFTNAQSTLLTSLSEKPLGFLVVAGPTGSGKTTTLHTMLTNASNPGVNITTIEDPVEYRLANANQIQVNPTQDITFAQGLRAIVRQDPDIILIGEIRDTETAEIAVNAALTGHRVFSTFHANSAAVAVPRFLDMDIEPFLLSSTLTAVVGQRLVRTLCPECRYSYTPTRKALDALVPKSKRFFDKKSETLYKGRGCSVCNDFGYSGRTVISEILEITPTIRDLILKRSDATAIETQARKEGMMTMFEAGVEAARAGITSIEELTRVVSPPEK